MNWVFQVLMWLIAALMTISAVLCLIGGLSLLINGLVKIARAAWFLIRLPFGLASLDELRSPKSERGTRSTSVSYEPPHPLPPTHTIDPPAAPPHVPRWLIKRARFARRPD